MTRTEQSITAAVQKGINSSIGSNLNAMAKALGEAAVGIIRDRTQDGIDREGRRFGSYTSGYLKAKQNFLRGGSKGKSAARLRSRKTEFAATKPNDKLRLSGELFSDIAWQTQRVINSANQITLQVRLYIKERSRLKAEGLMSTQGRNRSSSYSKKAWLFFGIMQGARRAQEEKLLLDKLSQILRTKNIRILS